MAAKKGRYTYDYPRPAVTVDIVVVSHGPKPKVLLIRRKHAPFAGKWAIPGGFVDEGETLEEAARRELLEETGIEVEKLRQVGAFGDPGRDPRGWTIAVAFLARVRASKVNPKGADDATEAAWHSLARPPALAFDHAKILEHVRSVLPKARKRK